MAELEYLEFEMWKASVLPESQEEASFVVSLGSAAAFSLHLSLKKGSARRAGSWYFAQGVLYWKVRTVALDSQDEKSHRKPNPKNLQFNSSQSQPSWYLQCHFLSLLGSSDHAELFWCAKTSRRLPIIFLLFECGRTLGGDSGRTDRLGEVVRLLWQQTDWLAGVDQLSWSFCLWSIIQNMINLHWVFCGDCCQEDSPYAVLPLLISSLIIY